MFVELISEKTTPELWRILIKSIKKTYDFKENHKEQWDFMHKTLMDELKKDGIYNPAKDTIERDIGIKFITDDTFQSKYKVDFASELYYSGYVKKVPTNTFVIVDYIEDFLKHSKEADKAYQQALGKTKQSLKGFKTATYGKKSQRDSISQLENSVRNMF